MILQPKRSLLGAQQKSPAGGSYSQQLPDIVLGLENFKFVDVKNCNGIIMLEIT
jgi:hypothetical protein